MLHALKIKKVRIIINFLIASSILLSYYFLYFLASPPEVYKTVFQFYIIVISLLLIGYYRIINAFGLLILFFISNTIFMYGSILFKEPNDIRGLFFDPYYFSLDTYMFIIQNLYFNLSGFVFGLFLVEIFSKSDKSLYIEKKDKLNKYDKKIATILFYGIGIAMAISFIFAYEKISLLLVSTYLEARKYDSLYLRLYHVFFIPLLLLALSLRVNVTQKKKLFFLLFVEAVISGLQGARGGFVVSIMFYIWYSSFVFGNKINIFKAILYAIFFTISITILSALRSDSHEISVALNIGDTITDIAIEQGSSVALIGYYVDYPIIQNNPSSVPFIFGVFDNFYLLLFDKETHHLNASSAIYAKNSSIVGQRISAVTNPNLYESGAGLGGNYILEEYNFMGFFGIVLLTALYVYMLHCSQAIIIYSNSILLKIILLGFIYYSFFMPRTQYFVLGVTQIGAIFLVYFFYVILSNYLRKGTNR